MKNVRCCDCGWLLNVKLECDAPAPGCLDELLDNDRGASMRMMSATNCMMVRSCDSYEPLKKEPTNVQS